MSLEEAGSKPDLNGSLERKIDRQLDALPSDIRTKWQTQYNDLPDSSLPKFSDKLGTFLGQREKALMGTNNQMFSGIHHLIEDKEAIAKTLEVIYEAEGRTDLYVGEGKTAHVYRDPTIPALCYKYVKDFREYEEWNSVDKEAKFLEALEDLSVAGARVPALNGVIDLPDTKVIAMEFIDAPSLDMVFERGRQLPAGFDATVFFRKLRDFVSAMHERNIYHRDLHEGNVLVGKDNTPYIIDFGRAVYAVSPDFAYEAYDRTGTNKIMLNSDEQWIYAVETKMQRYAAETGIAAK